MAVVHLGRQIRRGGSALGEQRQALRDVAQLADVAGPVVGHERPLGVRRQGEWLVGGESPQEMRDQQRHVLAAVAQRRELAPGTR